LVVQSGILPKRLNLLEFLGVRPSSRYNQANENETEAEGDVTLKIIEKWDLVLCGSFFCKERLE
jgi:hypothetical protein